MQKLFKAIGILSVLGSGILLLNAWVKLMMRGNLSVNVGGFLMTILIIVPFAVIIVGFFLIRWIVKTDLIEWWKPNSE